MTEAQQWLYSPTAVHRGLLFGLFFIGFLIGSWVAWALTEWRRDYLERKGKE